MYPTNGQAELMLTPTINRSSIMAGLIFATVSLDFRSEILHGQNIERSLKFINTPPPVAARNQRCPCGSGKKYKRCCITATKEVRDGTG